MVGTALALMAAATPGTPLPGDIFFRLLWIAPVIVFIVAAPLILRYLGSDRDVEEWHDEDLPPP
jgi:ABC-type sugar transport system permease subunit